MPSCERKAIVRVRKSPKSILKPSRLYMIDLEPGGVSPFVILGTILIIGIVGIMVVDWFCC